MARPRPNFGKRVCIACGRDYERRPDEPGCTFATRKFCTVECRRRAQKFSSTGHKGRQEITPEGVPVTYEGCLDVSPSWAWAKKVFTTADVDKLRAELHAVQKELERPSGLPERVRLRFEATERRLLDVLRYRANVWTKKERVGA